jgi:hypothetical protein
MPSVIEEASHIDLTENPSSDKEVSPEIEKQVETRDFEPTNTIGPGSPEPENESFETARADTDIEAGTAGVQQPRLKRSNSRVSSIGGASMRTLSSRVSSTLSLTLSHVQSVLSASNSWRSSLIYAMSTSSGRLSSTQELPWTQDDFDLWNQLIDESLLGLGSIEHSDDEAKSLQTRLCCGLKEDGRNSRGGVLICYTCGFADAHLLARSQLWTYSLKDFTTKDRFGNSSLHHTAAAGNILRVKEILLSVANASSSELVRGTLQEKLSCTSSG